MDLSGGCPRTRAIFQRRLIHHPNPFCLWLRAQPLTLPSRLPRTPAQVAADPAYARNTLISGAQSTRLLYILEDDPLFLELVDWAPLMPYVKALINPMPHCHASEAIVEQGSELLARKVGYYLPD